ncbi:GntR family transcriptional regulator [Kordiimonas pumila]|uniref:GntR family transcriptional regulator n=1 Tax=Kordiimonas pumila TaxID=2161677 RepID=A0ABV7D8K1_9PROT|nr:FCD domain-containing protein [Kordiimonas pumila]
MQTSESEKVMVKTLADYAYKTIRADIIAGALPPGEKLRLEMLCKRYDIGMSPLREALARLIGDNLVKTEGQRGFWVSGLSVEELDDLVRVRNLIETEALQLSLQRGGDAWKAKLTEAFERLTAAEERLASGDETVLKEWEDMNRIFHQVLISECGSPWLMRMLANLYQQSERYRRISIHQNTPDRDVHEEHHAIYEAAMEKQTLKASRLIERHLTNTADAVKRAFYDMSEGVGS